MRHALPAALALALAACTVGPDYKGLPDGGKAVEQFPTLAAGGPLVPSEPPELWWAQLRDPQLDALIDRALKANYDVRVAVANLEAARAVLAQTQTQELPTVTTEASIQQSRQQLAAIQPTDRVGSARTAASVGLSASWELDLFGRVRRSVEAASADLDQAEELRRDTLTVVASDTARAYIDLRGAQLRLDVARRNAENQQRTFGLTRTLRDAGRATDLDIARAQAQLTNTLATIPPLEAAVTAARNRLSTLTATPLGALAAELDAPRPLPEVPAFVAAGDPGGLVRRRPDIRSAERALAGSSARIGVATADLFPRVNLLGSIGVAATDPSRLLTGGAFGFGIGPSLSWTIFDREAIYARIRQADATADASLARYQKAVSGALQETDSALSAYVRELDRRLQLRAAADASRRAADLANQRYEAGVENFLTVLDAQRVLLQAEDLLAQSDIQIAQNLIAVYKALGGGWESAPAAAVQRYREP
jgi:outer membrane protein, multidrug efflux system